MIDNINRRIIDALKSDGRYSYAGLAKELGLNVATVARRIDRMLQEDVITIKAVLNPFKIGYNAQAVITLDIELTKVEQISAANSKSQYQSGSNRIRQIRYARYCRFSHLERITGIYLQGAPQG